MIIRLNKMERMNILKRMMEMSQNKAKKQKKRTSLIEIVHRQGPFHQRINKNPQRKQRTKAKYWKARCKTQ